MKPSCFTVTYTDNDNAVVYYNVLTQALAVCPADIDAANDPLLAQEGLFVNEDADEVSALRLRYARDMANTKNFCLAIAPTLECNFTCPYCYEREVRHAGVMSPEAQDALIAWIEHTYQQQGSEHLQILWYGGEPLMGLSAIEHISHKLIKDGFPLESVLISNCALATEETIQRLTACNISRVTATIDGVGEQHDIHRPAANGKPTYDTIVEALKNFQARGIEVHVLFNEDRSNTANYDHVVNELAALGIYQVSASQVFDYCQCLDKCEDFTRAKYDLFDDAREFPLKQYQRATAQGISEEYLAGLMAPIRLFCSRQNQLYYVVDEKGLLYECDGDVGYTNRALGSIFDESLPSHKAYDPFTDPLCKDCAFLPLCMGNCRWTRDSIGQCCAPQKAIIQEILHDWRALLDEGVEGVRILRAATAPSYYLW